MYGIVLQQPGRTRAVVIVTRLISPGDALSSKNQTVRRKKKKKKTSREQLKEWPEVVAVTGNGQCIAEKQVSRVHSKQREGEGGERMGGGQDFYSPDRTGGEYSNTCSAYNQDVVRDLPFKS